MFNMFNITLVTLFLLPEVDDHKEPPLLAALWMICVELIIDFLLIWILFERSLRIGVQQKMAERDGKMTEHEAKLVELIAEFKQVFIYPHGLVADVNDFVVPFHDTVMGFFEIRDLITGADAPTKDGDNPAAAAGVEISSDASCPHNKFMRKAQECLVLVAFTRKSLRDLSEHGYDDAVAQAGPIDARYADDLAEFKRKMAELEAQWEFEPGSDSDLEYEDLKENEEDKDEDDGMSSLPPAYDNKTRLVSFCNENGVVIPKTHVEEDGELLA